MFRNPELKRLELRKNALMLQSEANRQQLAAEVAHLLPVLGWCDLGLEVFQKVKSFWPLVAPVAGFVFASKWRGSRFWAGMTSTLRALKSFAAVWKYFQAR